MEVKRVLLPVHGDDPDQESLQLACKLTKESKGKVYVLYVIEVSRQLPLDADISSETARGRAGPPADGEARQEIPGEY